MSRNLTLNETIQLTTEVCYSCAVVFAMPTRLKDMLLDKAGTTFYCPNGHAQVYVGETRAQKIQKLENERDRLKAEKDRAEQDAKVYRDEAIAERDAKIKERTKRKQIETRVKNGVCPFCNRTFADLAAHMSTKHSKKKATCKHP